MPSGRAESLLSLRNLQERERERERVRDRERGRERERVGQREREIERERREKEALLNPILSRHFDLRKPGGQGLKRERFQCFVVVIWQVFLLRLVHEGGRQTCDVKRKSIERLGVHFQKADMGRLLRVTFFAVFVTSSPFVNKDVY